MFQFSELDKWMVFCPKSLTDQVVSILTFLAQCGAHFKYFSSQPQCFFVEEDTEESWKEGFAK